MKALLAGVIIALMSTTVLSETIKKDNRLVNLKGSDGGRATAFIVDMDGEKYLWTTKHVPIRDHIMLKIVGEGTVECPKVYTTPDPDGPLVCKIPDSEGARRLRGFKISDTMPEKNEVVHTMGFAGDGNLTYQEGKIQGGNAIDGGPHNTFSNRVSPGQSGSPLLNSDDEVVGVVFWVDSRVQSILSGASTYSSVIAARDTLAGKMNTNTPVKGKGTLIVFTAPEWCGPCRDMEPALNSSIPEIEKRGLTVIKVSDSHPDYKKYRAAYLKKTGKKELYFPTMWIEGSDQAKVGRQDRTSILGFVLKGIKNIAELLFGYPEEQHVPKPPRQDAPPAPQGELSGEVSQDEGVGEAVPAPPVESVAWDDVTIVAVVKRTADKTPVGDVAKRKALDILKSKLRKVNEDVLEGKAQIEVVSERISPDRFDAVVVASGVVPDPIALVVMVKEKSLGLKSLIAGIVEKKIMAKIPESTKFEIIFERINSSYEEMQTALLTPSAERFERETSAIIVPDVKPEGMTDEQFSALQAENKETRSKLDKVMDVVAAIKDTKKEDGSDKSIPERVIAVVLALLGAERTGSGIMRGLAGRVVKRVLGGTDEVNNVNAA
jgi:thiol-disulfide isomerase/thioredoxin